MNNQKPQPCTKTWKQKDGSEIRVCDMDISHLENTIKMLERAGYAKMHKLHNESLSWAEPQGEMAAMVFEDGLDELLEDICYGHFEKYVNPIYFDMLEEVDRRICERQQQLNKYIE